MAFPSNTFSEGRRLHTPHAGLPYRREVRQRRDAIQPLRACTPAIAALDNLLPRLSPARAGSSILGT